MLAQGHGAGASVTGGQPASLAHRVAQTRPIVLVGGTERIPLRLGMGHVADVHTVSLAVAQVRRTGLPMRLDGASPAVRIGQCLRTALRLFPY